MGSFPLQQLTDERFLARFDALEAGAPQHGVAVHAAHVNLKDGRAFCFMCGPDDEESVRKAHEAIHFPYDSITEVRRVTGADMRPPGKPSPGARQLRARNQPRGNSASFAARRRRRTRSSLFIDRCS